MELSFGYTLVPLSALLDIPAFFDIFNAEDIMHSEDIIGVDVGGVGLGEDSAATSYSA